MGWEQPPRSVAEWARRAAESQARADLAREEADRMRERVDRGLLPRSRWILLGCAGVALFIVGLLMLMAVVIGSAR